MMHPLEIESDTYPGGSQHPLARRLECVSGPQPVPSAPVAAKSLAIPVQCLASQRTILFFAETLKLVSAVALIWLLTGSILSIAQEPGNDPFSGGTSEDPFGGSPFDSDPFGTAQPGPQTQADQAAGGAATPFGGVGQAQPPNTAAAPPGESAPESNSVVRYLQANPPRTPKQMADALKWMVRIQRWDEVGRLLDRTSALGWDTQQQAKVARSAGSALMMKISSAAQELSDSQIQQARQILSAPSNLARSQQYVDRWIDQLASQEAAERRLAQLRLQDSGSAAIRSLIQRLLNGPSAKSKIRVPPIMLAGTLLEFGRDGEAALKAACLVEDAQAAGRVLQAMATLPGKQFSAELGATVFNRDLPQDVRQTVSRLLEEKYGNLPSATAVRTYLVKQFNKALSVYQSARTDGASVQDAVWRLNAERTGVERVELPVEDRFLERLAELATHRLRLSEARATDVASSSAVLLQRAYRLDSDLASQDIQQHSLIDLPQRYFGSTGFWKATLQQADEMQLHGAAVRAVQLMVQAAESGKLKTPLDLLSGLLDDPRPIVRYSALEGLARLDPQADYLGAAKALQTAMEMAKLGGGPNVLVVGLTSERRQAAAGQLIRTAGASVIEASTGQAALKALRGHDPIEYVIVVDRVPDLSLFELLQRLRNSKQAGLLPIAVVTDELYQHERSLIDKTPGAVQTLLTTDPAQMPRILNQLEATLDTQPLREQDRSFFAAVAARFLTKVADDRKTYGFYPIADWQQHLVATDLGLSANSQAKMLSAVGSAENQEKLFRMTADTNLSEDGRMQAAREFARSVRDFGMLMNRADVLSAYEAYNELGPNDEVAVKAIGFVLDVIEAHAGQRDWPDGF